MIPGPHATQRDIYEYQLASRMKMDFGRAAKPDQATRGLLVEHYIGEADRLLSGKQGKQMDLALHALHAAGVLSQYPVNQQRIEAKYQAVRAELMEKNPDRVAQIDAEHAAGRISLGEQGVVTVPPRVSDELIEQERIELKRTQSVGGGQSSGVALIKQSPRSSQDHRHSLCAAPTSLAI